MASEYKQGSPTSDLLHLDSMAPTSAFRGSQSGSEYGFGTPQSVGIDAMMQGGGNGGATNSLNNVGSYRSAPGNVSATQNFGSAFDVTMMPSPSMLSGNGPLQHHGSLPGLQDGSSPALGHHHHRLSISSNGPYAMNERQNSMAGSDNTSPGAHGRGSLGENAFAENSNDTVNSQSQGGLEGGSSKADDAQDAILPAWSELKTKAGKERKRLPLACIACRRKKIRCSGEKPACKHCLRSRIPCVYKVTTRKAAPRTDYMAMLDKRLKRMEERVIKILPKEEQNVVANTGRAVVRPPLPPPPPKPASASKKRGAEQAFGDELDEWANGRPTNGDSKEAVQREAEPDKTQPHDAEEQNLLLEGADKLPPKQLQEHLTEVFFDFVYGQSYHLLHKPSFLRKLAQGTVPPVLMLAVCGISARFSSHPAVRTEPAFLRGESWASAARDIALRRYDTPNITILIVYLILGLHEFGTCQGGRSWMFGGMAQRMAYALQLHKDLDHDPKARRGSDGKNGEGELTFTDREIRRRTMWSCFLMDRFNSSGTDRPIFVAEQYIRAQLPIKESYYQMEITGPTEDLDGNVPNPVSPDTGQVSDAKENMGVAAYLIRLVAIWGKLVHYLNLGGKDRDERPMWAEDSVFHNIKSDTKKWVESLPPSLTYTPENLQNAASEKLANHFLLLHIVHNQIILFSNRFALPMPGMATALPKDMPTEFVQAASRAAFDAANQISALVHEAMDHMVVAPFAGYCAFFSSTVHIYGALSKNAQLEARSKQNLAWNVKYLTKMKKYWGMFHFVTENLRELYRRHADAARSGAASKALGSEDGESAIFQYGDWFDRYPHGVSGTDYEEPSVEIKKEPGSDAVLGQKSDLQTVEEFFSKLSPPSRAAHLQQQQQQQKKTAKKRRASKAERQNTGSSSSGMQQQQQRQQQDLQAGQAFQPQSLPEQQMQSMLAAQGFNSMAEMRQHSVAFPPGFQPPPNPLLANAPQHLLSQLDRQMVLNSYAGVDPMASHRAQAFQQQHNLHDQASNMDPFNLDAFSGHTNNAPNNNGNGNTGAEFWGDGSTAWFMPFNMEPPSIGDDNNLFANSNSFDWASFGGFGDLASGGMPSTGLTPQPSADVDTGQENQGGGLEEFEGMR
ncbi:hypothetical protein LTR85_004186 [Meristemomyces frigidus]|nr:hypothetical protein LTR85_004186 [Meristemomyces frigidus]